MSTYCWSQADSSIQLLWIIRSVCWFLCIKSCHKCKSKCSLLTADTEYTFPTKGGYVLTILFGYMIITVSLFAYHGSCALFPHRRVFRLIPNYRGIFWHEQSISNKVHAYCVQAGIVQHSHRLPIVVVLTEMQRGLSANSIVWQRALTTLSLLYDIFFGNWAIGQLPIIFNRIPVETVNTYLILCINCMATYQISTFFPHIRMLSCSIWHYS